MATDVEQIARTAPERYKEGTRQLMGDFQNATPQEASEVWQQVTDRLSQLRPMEGDVDQQIEAKAHIDTLENVLLVRASGFIPVS